MCLKYSQGYLKGQRYHLQSDLHFKHKQLYYMLKEKHNKGPLIASDVSKLTHPHNST